tara:strand:+ start:106 stop:240 length:135 start_codon:yes stop_codon:yes gene_type:complete
MQWEIRLVADRNARVSGPIRFAEDKRSDALQANPCVAVARWDAA